MFRIPNFGRIYEHRIAPGLSGTPAPAALLDEDDLGPLPPPVAEFIRRTGWLGKPRPRAVQAAWRGRIRGGPDQPWMRFTAEQTNFPDRAERFFRMRARRGGLPVDVLHEFADSAARMRVRLLSVIPIVDAHGPEMTRAETVTLLNDLCLLAPGALVDPAIRWEPIDDSTARAVYTHAADTVSATLHFDADGDLVDFVSDDRFEMLKDGTLVRRRWSTPVREYRTFSGYRVFTRGEGIWHADTGDYPYLEIELLDHRVHPHVAG